MSAISRFEAKDQHLAARPFVGSIDCCKSYAHGGPSLTAAEGRLPGVSRFLITAFIARSRWLSTINFISNPFLPAPAHHDRSLLRAPVRADRSIAPALPCPPVCPDFLNSLRPDVAIITSLPDPLAKLVWAHSSAGRAPQWH